MVCLTPDALEDLEEVEEDRIYVLGGIVDRMVEKNRSLLQAISTSEESSDFGVDGCVEAGSTGA